MKQKAILAARFAAFFLLFAVIVTIIGVPLSYASRPTLANTRKNISGFYDEPDHTLDVVMIGTSGSFTAYCPMEAWNKYGYTSYNFCINVLAVDVIPYCVVEVLKTQQPKVLVIDCYPFIAGQTMRTISKNEQDDAYLHYNTDAFRYSFNRTALIRNTIPKGYSKSMYYFDIFKYFGSPEFDLHYADWKQHDISKGFNGLFWGPVALNHATDSSELPLSSELDEALTAILDTCRRADCKVLFVYYPYALIQPARDIGYDGDDALRVLNYMKRRVQANGFDYLNMVDFYTEIGIDPARDYMEYAHFNIYGAEKITDFFGQYLMEHYDLIDQRENPAFRQWHTDYADWEVVRARCEKDIDRQIMEAGGK